MKRQTEEQKERRRWVDTVIVVGIVLVICMVLAYNAQNIQIYSAF